MTLTNATTSRKRLNAFDFRLKTPGTLSKTTTQTLRKYTRISGVPPKDSAIEHISYDGFYWRFLSTSSIDSPQRVNWSWKSAKSTSRFNATGFRPPRPFTRSLIELDEGEGSGIYVSGSTLTMLSGATRDSTNFSWNLDQLVSTTSGLLVSQTNSVNRAEVEALVKLKDMKVNFGEALAESRSTLHHLTSTVKTVLSAYNYARRGKWSKLLKALKVNPKRRWSTKDPASRWLEMQFGWTPLISDIHGSYELFQAGLRERSQLFSVERNIINGLAAENVSSLAGERYSNSSSLFTGTRGVAVKLYAKVRDEDVANISSLGLSDPAQVAWALVPFSFVVDWILPVGSFLEALGATKGLTFVSGTRTEFISGSIQVNSSYTYSATVKSDGIWTRHGHVACVDRKTYAGFPRPVPYIKSPFSSSHLVSALALIRTIAFKR